MNKAVGEFLFCGGFGRWEALVLYGGDLWQIIYGCSSDYHDIVSSNLLSINFFLSISQLISFSGIVCVVMHDIFKEPSDQQTFVTLSQHRKRHNRNSQHHQDHSCSTVQSLWRCFIGKYGCDSCPEEGKDHTQDPYCPVWCAADGKVG